MNHAACQRRVLAAERRFAERRTLAQAQLHALKTEARAAATAPRLVVVGLLGGFALGLGAPLARLGSLPKLLQLVTGVLGFVNALHVQKAAQEAGAAADEVNAASQRIDASV